MTTCEICGRMHNRLMARVANDFYVLSSEKYQHLMDIKHPDKHPSYFYDDELRNKADLEAYYEIVNNPTIDEHLKKEFIEHFGKALKDALP